MFSKYNHLIILTVLVSQYFAEHCSTLRLYHEKSSSGRSNVVDDESSDFMTIDPSSQEMVMQQWKTEATEFQYVKNDFYEIDWASDKRLFVIIHVWNVITDVYPWIWYSQGQLTVDRSGVKLIATPSSQQAAKKVSMCDKNVFEFVGRGNFKLIKHNRGRKKSVVCAVKSRTSIKIVVELYNLSMEMVYHINKKINAKYVNTWPKSIVGIKGDSKGSRITLEMIEQHFQDFTINPGGDIPVSMEPDLDSNQTILYSLDKDIYLWNTSQGRELSSKLIENDAIISFYRISSHNFLVSEGNLVKVYQLPFKMGGVTHEDTLVCTQPGCCPNSSIGCRESGSRKLGPIAVDYNSTSQVVFYIDSSSIYRVNLSANAMSTSFDFSKVGGSATAMAFNSDYSTAYIFSMENSVITANSFNLQTQKSSPLQLNGLANPVKQAISIDDKGILLCRTSEYELLLVDINTGDYSGVMNEVTHLPCPGDCEGESLRVRTMVDIKNQGYLLAVNKDFKLIKLKYNVPTIHGDINNITDTTEMTAPSDRVTSTTTSDEGIDAVPTIAGCTVAAVVFIVRILAAVLCVLYTKKRRQLIQKFPQHRRRRIPSAAIRVIEDFAMSTHEQRDDQRATPQPRERDRELDVRTSHNENLSQAPSHPQPIQHRSPLENKRTNSAYVPDEPYYEEVLGNVERPISVQASMPRPPYVQPRVSDLPHNSRAVSTASLTSELSNTSPLFGEPAYCDNDQVPHDCDAENAEYSYAVEPRFLSNSSDKPSAFTSARRSLSQNRERDRELDVRPFHSDNLQSQVPSPPLPIQYRSPREHMRTNNGDVPDGPYYEEVLENVESRIQAPMPRPPYVPPRPRVSDLPPIPNAVNTAQHRGGLSNNNLNFEESPYCDNDQVPHDHDGLYVDYAYAVEPRSLSNSSDEPSAFISAKRSSSHIRESDRGLDVRPSHNDNLSQAPSPPLVTQQRPPIEHSRSNDAYVPDGQYNEEVLENVERPINIQASVPQPLYVPPRTSALPPFPSAVSTSPHGSELSNNRPRAEESPHSDNSPAPLDRDAVEPRTISSSSDESSAFTSAWRSLSHTLSGVLQTISAEFEKPSDSEITF